MGDEERAAGTAAVGYGGCQQDDYEREEVRGCGEGLGGEGRVAHAGI